MEVSGSTTLLSRSDQEEAGWAVRVGLGLLEKRKLSCPAGIRNPVRLARDAVTVPTTVVRLPETLK